MQSVLAEDAVGADNTQILDLRLRDKETIKRIAMQSWQTAGLERMGKFYRQGRHSRLVEQVGKVWKKRFRPW